MVSYYNHPDLFERKVRVFEENSLSQIAFPIGGIGTGTVSLGGRGNLRDWEIFNRPGKGKNLPYTFFSIWFKKGDDA
ncbi:MAG: GH116 family glycosyl-hydrolase, partial [Thermoproteota archaeon]